MTTVVVSSRVLFGLLMLLLLGKVQGGAVLAEQDGVCDDGVCQQSPSRALFQKSRSFSSEAEAVDGENIVGPLASASRPGAAGDVSRHSFINANTSEVRKQGSSQNGADAPLNEAGYLAVAALCCEIEMETFITRMIFQAGYDICAEGGLHGLVIWFDCTDDKKTFAELESELLKAPTGSCPWLGQRPNCPATTGCINSPGPAGSHRRRSHCMGATTTPAPLPTQPPGTDCQGTTQDIVVAIDASKSVANEGWDAEAKFAADLVSKITANGNPGDHQISVYWFNEETMYVPSAGKTVNQVGDFSKDGAMLQSEILKLDYPSIRAGATDHPQVFETAKAAWQLPGARAGAGKTLVLITDGETHNGLDCPKEDDRTTVEAELGQGQCLSNANHVCYARGCSFNKGKCMCGMYKASLFKKQGFKLVVVGVKNMHHVLAAEAGIFEEQMRFMASPNNAFLADNFEDMNALIPSITGSLCA